MAKEDQIEEYRFDNRTPEEQREIARNYINEIGGFEKFAEWGLF